MSGINSAMLAGVTGLSANSSALAAISEDIANVDTVGYKANNVQFADMVTNSAGASYSTGGVQTNVTQDVTSQGVLQAASSPTDMAIQGDGFFVTAANPNSPSVANTPLFTRAGGFTSNSQGYLVNASGDYLEGWIADPNGNIVTDPSNLSLLQPINISQISSDPVPTTTASVSANLEFSQDVSAAAPQVYDSVADSAAVSHNFTVSYASSGTPGTWDVTVNDSLAGSGPYTGTVTYDPNTGAITGATGALSTTTGLTLGSTATVSLAALGLGTSTNATASYDASTDSMAAYTSSSGANGTKPDFSMQIPISDSQGGTQTVQLDLLKSDTPNQWYAEIVAVPASSVTTAAGVPAGQIASGVISFDSNGNIDTANTSNSLLNLTFGASNAAAPTAPGVNWAPSSGISGQGVALNLSQLSQQNSASTVNSISTNGKPSGSLSSIQVSSSGVLTGVFSNGVTRTIAQVAIATFPNPDGLTAVSGDAYQASLASGAYTLKTAGLSGAGTVASSNLESSTVDLSTEFTQMITTQRAYSASSKIITTADSMLQDLISIIR